MEKPSFVNSSLIAAAFFGILSTALSVFAGYTIINSEPTGSPFPPGTWIQGVTCLVGAFASFVAVKLQVENEPVMLPGRGAVIGLVTGVAMTLVAVLGGLVWEFADPGYANAMMEAMRRHFEAVPNFTEEQVEAMVDDMQSNFTIAGRLKTLGIGALVSGLLNSVTGLLAVRIFAEKPAEEL